MTHKLLAILTMVLATTFAKAEQPLLPVQDATTSTIAQILDDRADIPVVDAWTHAGGVLAFHIDRSVTFLNPTPDGLGVSIGDDDADEPAAQQVPELRTSYKDANDATHTIVTPVVSSTPAGLRNAIETHQRLVEAMQAIYPPA